MNQIVRQKSAIDNEIAAYHALEVSLLTSSSGKWVVFCQGAFQGSYDDFNDAAADAIHRFGRGPYLIRQVGESDCLLPASVLYAASHDAS